MIITRIARIGKKQQQLQLTDIQSAYHVTVSRHGGLCMFVACVKDCKLGLGTYSSTLAETAEEKQID